MIECSTSFELILKPLEPVKKFRKECQITERRDTRLCITSGHVAGANVGPLAGKEQACSQPAYSGDVRQSLGACTTSSPVTLTENARRRPVVPWLPCKQSMWKASASPGSTPHCSSLNAEGSPSMSGTGSKEPLGNHLGVSVKNVVGRYHLPVCEPDTKHRDDSTGTGSMGNQKETFCVPSML